jgi:hypothetical protein
MRTAVLGILGLVLAVVVGYGVHLITRETISLPVVQLEQPAQLAPPAATSTARTTTAETETETRERRPRIAERRPTTTAAPAPRARAGAAGAAVVATTTEA